ncbi:hypothetical protein EJ03DRAFT_158473 [Teratosphaeria nubilosa]|uniref:Uncharacterized protein n=1 Tax=Teratosphaeria nubilosa TaxID=161662 RepID=A0A6G1L4E2_9PEZI|nr:hypothetical protein EJ03DRAFT_158473 [Teratosphaeria nubilosa]
MYWSLRSTGPRPHPATAFGLNTAKPSKGIVFPGVSLMSYFSWELHASLLLQLCPDRGKLRKSSNRSALGEPSGPGRAAVYSSSSLMAQCFATRSVDRSDQSNSAGRRGAYSNLLTLLHRRSGIYSPAWRFLLQSLMNATNEVEHVGWYTKKFI